MRLESTCKPRKVLGLLPHFLLRSYRSSYQHWVHWARMTNCGGSSVPPLVFPAVVSSRSKKFASNCSPLKVDIYEAVSLKKKLFEVIKLLQVIKQAWNINWAWVRSWVRWSIYSGFIQMANLTLLFIVLKAVNVPIKILK